MHGGRILARPSFDTETARRNERTNEFGTTRRPGRGGVSFSVASDHRDRDRCDQPPRSRCTGQHHYTDGSALSFSLYLAFLILFLRHLQRPPFAFSVLLQPQTRSPDVSIARLRAPPRRWITRRRECYGRVINPRARKENEFNDPELSHRLLP